MSRHNTGGSDLDLPAPVIDSREFELNRRKAIAFDWLVEHEDASPLCQVRPHFWQAWTMDGPAGEGATALEAVEAAIAAES